MKPGSRSILRRASFIAVLATIAGTAGGLASTPASALGLPINLCPPLPASVCGVLGGGGSGGGTPSLPTGVATALPTSFKNTGTAQAVSITDPLGDIYSTLTSGVVISLVGTGTAAGETIPGTVGTISGTTIPVVFNMAPGGLPVAPGSYTMQINPANTSTAGLTTLLSTLGLSSLPVDVVSVTVTADKPTPTAQLALAPGASVPATINTAAASFAHGDAVSFTDSGGSPVSGLSLQNPQLSATSISGTLAAAQGVAPGLYNLAVTDAIGQVGTCTGCVTVSSSKTSAITMALSRAKVVAGQAVTLSGHLLSGGSALGSGPVYLFAKPAGEKVQLLKLVNSASNGAFSYTFTPTRNTTYAAYFEGLSNALGINLPALSNVLNLSVAPKLSLGVVTHRVKGHAHGARLVAGGRMSPAIAGTKVTLYNHGKRFGTAKVASNGTYRFVKKLARRGHYALQARTAKNTALAAGTSTTKHKTIH